MTRSLLLLLLLLLPAAPALALTGVDPPEDPTWSASPPGPAECRPPALCLPGQVVAVPLQALTTEDARAALLAVRLLADVEASAAACSDRSAQLALALDRCRTDLAALPKPSPLQPPGAAQILQTDWITRALWAGGGFVVGMVVGGALAFALSR